MQAMAASQQPGP